MGTTYEYTYEYEITDPGKGARNTGGHTQRSVAHSQHGNVIPHASRSDMIDPLANLQHDRIWSKLYDPVSMDKAQHDVEIQRMARRQDRKIIKIEAAHGSDRQTFIVKRDYDLRVRDVIDEASKAFKIPPEQVILYWKGRNICETPDALLESLGVQNNNTMRIARADEQYISRHRQQNQYQQAALSSSSSSGGGGGMYGQQSGAGGYYGSQGSYGGGYSGQQSGSSGYYAQQGSSSSSGAAAASGGMYGQQQSGSTAYYGQGGGSSSGELYGQQQYYPSQTYYSYSTGQDQQYGGSGHSCNCTCHQDQYQQQQQHQHHNCKCCCHCHGSHSHNQQV